LNVPANVFAALSATFVLPSPSASRFAIACGVSAATLRPVSSPLSFNPMYCPAHFVEDRPPELICLIEQFPLATIIGNSPAGLVADHIPLLFEADPCSSGKLIGHVAKSNPLWQHPFDHELLVVFQGPSTYISPNWYATKQDAGKSCQPGITRSYMPTAH
jgi:hypothetical protein